jgi:gliding motility-associated-like protein
LKKYLLLLTAILLTVILFAQTSVIDSPYHINGSAYKENCNCYTITPNEQNRSGSVWNINKIDLTQAFDYKFEVNLGCNDAGGADGMVFVLQPVSTNIGSTGGGIGFEGIRPSIGVVIDTWRNDANADPDFDHISINRDGDIGHNSVNNLAGPVSALASGNNIEDCQFHTFRISWDPAAKKLNAFIDGVERVSASIDLMTAVFNNDPKVFWGFSGATGGSMNHQRFCTSLKAGFSQPPVSETCAPHLLNFKDESSSFGNIVKWYWDFGDGSTSIEQQPAPHSYAEPGKYTVSSVVLGNNGCWSDTNRQLIIVGSIPMVGFETPDSLCAGSPLNLSDTSSVLFGTINKWNWTINGVSFDWQYPPPQPTTTVQKIQVGLSVKTLEGCESEVISKTVRVIPKPAISIPASSNLCAGDTLKLTGVSLVQENPVISWHWLPGNGMAEENIYRFISAIAGDFLIELTGTGENGCTSDAGIHTASFEQTNADAGRDTVVADNQPVQLNGTGGPILSWSPANGLNNPLIGNPVATIERPISYILTASTLSGCSTTDTIHIKVYKGPQVYIPNVFSPNADGRNDQFRFVAVGMRKMHFFRIYNRLGQLVHDSTDQSGWNGLFMGKTQPSGNYTWVISGEDYNGNAYMKNGNLLLLR